MADDLRLMAAYREAQRRKGDGPAHMSVPEAYRAGVEWTTRMLDEIGVPGGITELASAASDLASITLPRLVAIHRQGEISLKDFGEASLGAGFTTGIWTGHLLSLRGDE